MSETRPPVAATLAATVKERPAAPGDEAFCRALFIADRLPEFLAAGLDRPAAETLLADQFRLQTIGYATAHPAAETRLILAGDVPVGRIIEERRPDDVLVVDFVLRPEHRGRGIGSEVLDRVLFRARLRNVPVRLQAILGSPAVRLYARAGFEPEGVTTDRVQLVWHP